jgi:predicted CXXCH cytochrome family protein
VVFLIQDFPPDFFPYLIKQADHGPKKIQVVLPAAKKRKQMASLLGTSPKAIRSFEQVGTTFRRILKTAALLPAAEVCISEDSASGGNIRDCSSEGEDPVSHVHPSWKLRFFHGRLETFNSLSSLKGSRSMHVFRPVYIVFALVGLILVARTILVPADFGIQESGYMYGWYRKANEKEWKDFALKYRGKEYCADCHAEQDQQIGSSRHQAIECENCHGPGREHPSDPPKLDLDRTRELCLRCHTFLAYPTSKRSEIKGLDPDRHNPGAECVACHDPHRAAKPG